MNKKISLLKRLKERVRPRWLKAARKLAASRLKLGRLTNRLGLRAMDGNPLAARKRSDTLYILGSGESINRIRAEEWAGIAAADSIGFNFWLVHDFVPSLYVCEPMNEGSPEYECFFASLRARTADYGRTPILLKDGERHRSAQLERFLMQMPGALRGNVGLSWDWEIDGDSEAEFAAHLRRLHRRGWLASPRAPLFRKRASVFYLILLGLRAGYKRIVLCGIDLNHTHYFYESRRAEYAAQGRQVPPPPPPAPVHLTDDPRYGELTIARAIEALQREVLRPAGVELSVAFSSSRLHPMLPSFFGR